MKLSSIFTLGATALAVALPHSAVAQASPVPISLTVESTIETGIFDESAAEISAYDSKTRRLFIVNGGDSTIDVYDMEDPKAPSLVQQLDLAPYGAGANSVAIAWNTVAAAVEAHTKTDPGKVVFFSTDTLAYINEVTVGALPDMLTFTPDGKTLLVANEGEPEGGVDPEGSVSVIDFRKGAAGLTQADVRTAGFAGFNGAALDPSVRIFGPGATVAMDVEPEYIAVSSNSKTAWVTLQENNAVALLDVPSATITEIKGLGFKDHSLPGNGLDTSDKDDRITIATRPVYGMFQPDAIATFSANGQDYTIIANEGDSRGYEETEVGDEVLDPAVFPDAAHLQLDEVMGRLGITNTLGNTDADPEFEELYAFGARSFSILNAAGEMIYESGDELEGITAIALPEEFNSTNDENGSFDNRSDNKGPEPEGVTTGKLFGRTFAFIGLERIGGIVIYDVTEPTAPTFVNYFNNRDFSGDAEAGTAGDLGPEGILFVPASKSPNLKPLLIVANEVSGSTTIYRIEKD